MKNHFKGIISPADLAEATGKQYRWIMTIMPELVERGLAKKVARAFICHDSGIEYILNRPETRGRKKQ